jgi:Phage gp6-like head-tail connector protein
VLTTLSTVKSRLGITDSSTDDILTSAIKAASARFDKETNRTLARTENATFEFDPADTELSPPAYPIESVTRFETKSTEADGWQEITDPPDYLIRRACIITLASPLPTLNAPRSTARLPYTGGFLLPGTDPAPGQTPLPADLENACIEQVAFWFTNRDRLGLKTSWPSGDTYRLFATQDLLDSVKSTLSHHRRFTL